MTDIKKQLIVNTMRIILSGILVFALFCMFSAPAVSSPETEDEGALSEIEKTIKEESRQIQEILSKQTDKASRNLIIISAAIIAPVLLFLILWMLKLFFNISLSVSRSIFNLSASGVKSILKSEAENKPIQDLPVEESKHEKKHLRLGEILIGFVSKSINADQIGEALSEQEKDPLHPLLGEILLKREFATKGEIDAALKIQQKKK